MVGVLDEMWVGLAVCVGNAVAVAVMAFDTCVGVSVMDVIVAVGVGDEVNTVVDWLAVLSAVLLSISLPMTEAVLTRWLGPITLISI